MAAPLLAGMGALPLALQTALVGVLMRLQAGADVQLEELTVSVPVFARYCDETMESAHSLPLQHT
jgi:hypothetical protein